MLYLWLIATLRITPSPFFNLSRVVFPFFLSILSWTISYPFPISLLWISTPTSGSGPYLLSFKVRASRFIWRRFFSSRESRYSLACLERENLLIDVVDVVYCRESVTLLRSWKKGRIDTATVVSDYEISSILKRGVPSTRKRCFTGYCI